MIRKESIAAIALLVSMSICTQAQQNGSSLDPENLKKETFSSKDLVGWDFWGMGKAFESGGGICLTENDSTLGAVLISPNSYTGNVIIRYKTLALTSATVLVVMHSATDLDSEEVLNIPEDYNGSMRLWTHEKDNYFYAFRNGPHGNPPFIRRYPVPGKDALVTARENVMLPGVFYSVEIGKIGNRLWLSVDGKKIIETEDKSILAGGHIVFRIRGTAGFKAACLIKDLEIYSVK